MSRVNVLSAPRCPAAAAAPAAVVVEPFARGTRALQFAVAPAFVRFVHAVLETTQVSTSVVVLALHYVYRMRVRNRRTAACAGSEYRVAVAALMLANKFLDE